MPPTSRTTERPRRWPGGPQGGFTLLELLLAVTLGAVVLSAVYTTFNTALDANRRIARAAAASQTGRFFVERLRADLKNLLLDDQAVTGTRDALALRVASSRNGRPAPVEVGYRQRRSSVGAAVHRRVVNGGNATETVVYDGADQLRFRYLSRSAWQDSVSDALPQAVECVVTGRHGGLRFVVNIEVEQIDVDQGDAG